MNFRIRHRLLYRYSAPALLGPHILRLRPREDGAQRLLDHELSILPAPSLCSRQLDAFNNVEHLAWFLGKTDHLEIVSESVVETHRSNPFDFLLDGRFSKLPYGPSLTEAYPGLEPYLKLPNAPAATALAQKLCSEAKGETVAFLLRLNKWIFEHLKQESRQEADVWEPDRTLMEQRGACRDVSQLFLACVRSLGLPGRYVSGYNEGDPDLSAKDLHAWVEVFLPGGGWRGFDPTHGIAVADRHIVLCAAPNPADTAAVSGTFGGLPGGGVLEAEIRFM